MKLDNVEEERGRLSADSCVNAPRLSLSRYPSGDSMMLSSNLRRSVSIINSGVPIQKIRMDQNLELLEKELILCKDMLNEEIERDRVQTLVRSPEFGSFNPSYQPSNIIQSSSRLNPGKGLSICKV
jgi:hypothetical protein